MVRVQASRDVVADVLDNQFLKALLGESHRLVVITPNSAQDPIFWLMIFVFSWRIWI